jgi:GNAT superfamily N-acetyltransferase
MAEASRDLDGYPPFLRNGDFVGFLVSEDALDAWVAESEGTVCGHVTLHTRSSRPVMELAAATLGVSREELGVVARLFVDPGHRRSGAGLALLDVAAGAGRERGLLPILDVHVGLTKAIALYEAAGWKRIGEVTVRLADDFLLDEYVYAAPA